MPRLIPDSHHGAESAGARLSMVYVHIPFCAAKCAYCDFYSRPPRRGEPDEMVRYVDALEREWEMRRHECDSAAGCATRINSVYIGGGTPSLLSPSLLERILRFTGAENAAEVTVEANPEQITPDYARALASLPVGRVSLGVQSLDDDLLRIVGRRHTAAQALEAIGRLQTLAGIDNYSIDLIYGLPGQTAAAWEDTLRLTTEQLRPPHLSCYMLSYEKGTRLEAMRKRGIVTPADDDTLAEMWRMLCDIAPAAGYDHYEISNLALGGRRRAVHNSGYWRGLPYLGLGAAAHSFDGRATRSYNPSDLKAYLSAIESGHVACERAVETAAELCGTTIMTALRTREGIDTVSFAAVYGEKALARLERSARPWLKSGHLVADPDGHLRCTPGGWLLSDAIIVDLLPDDED